VLLQCASPKIDGRILKVLLRNVVITGILSIASTTVSAHITELSGGNVVVAGLFINIECPTSELKTGCKTKLTGHYFHYGTGLCFTSNTPYCGSSCGGILVKPVGGGLYFYTDKTGKVSATVIKAEATLIHCPQ